MIAAGTSAVSARVQPAAGFAMQSGACMVEINPHRTLPSGHSSHALDGLAALVLPTLARALRDCSRDLE